MQILDEIWTALDDVKDPEIPVVSVVEMGLVRKVTVSEGGSVSVTITPTFSGCPALDAMKTDIIDRLQQMGIDKVSVVTANSPAWSTDWIAETARAKLKAFGITPAPQHGGSFEVMLLDAVACPYCGSEKTTLRNSFGPTLCRMIFYCNNCQQPFEQFKPL
jgi:ring-1,2-phenylacetyl-CoA epoxidase subunit PaaD